MLLLISGKFMGLCFARIRDVVGFVYSMPEMENGILGTGLGDEKIGAD